MQIVIERAAQADVRSIIRFYEKCEPGAGGYFLQHFRQEVPRLLKESERLRKRHGFQFMQMRRFPIGLYYRLTEDTASICAVIDLRRDQRAVGQPVTDIRQLHRTSRHHENHVS